MDFKLSKSEKLFKWAVQDFAKRELADRTIKNSDHITDDIILKIGGLGFLGLQMPKEYGGIDAKWLELGILIEEMAKCDAGLAYYLLLSNLIGLCLADYGTDTIRTKVLSKLISGNMMGSVAMTEKSSGCDLSSINTTALRQKELYIINGRKTPVSFGGQADFTLVFAKAHTASGKDEISVFLVPLDQTNIISEEIPTMGLASTATTSLNFVDVQVPEINRIGEEGQGILINKRFGLSSSLSRVLSALICIGMAQRSLEMATFYANKRVAFGRPVSHFQGISNKIAEDETLVEAARWFCYRTLWLKDTGSDYSKEAAMCCWWCPKVSFQAIENSLLIHGHYGYSDDFPLEKMLRDVVAFEMISGSEQMLKTIIAKKVLGSKGIPDSLTKMVELLSSKY